MFSPFAGHSAVTMFCLLSYDTCPLCFVCFKMCPLYFVCLATQIPCVLFAWLQMFSVFSVWLQVFCVLFAQLGCSLFCLAIVVFLLLFYNCIVPVVLCVLFAWLLMFSAFWLFGCRCSLWFVLGLFFLPGDRCSVFCIPGYGCSLMFCLPSCGCSSPDVILCG